MAELNQHQPPVILPVSVAGTIQRDTDVPQQIVIRVAGIGPPSRPCYPQQNIIADLFPNGTPHTLYGPGQMVIDKTLSPHSLVEAARNLLNEVRDLVLAQAMVIASEEPAYSDIFDGTNLVGPMQVFFETPHRSSDEDGWVSILEDLVESHYCGPKGPGPWLTERLGMLAREHEELAPQFASISSNFNLMSYYHTPEPADPRPVMSKHCATLGFTNEERVAILIYRHHGMLEEYESRCLNDLLCESKMMNSPDIRAFLDLLCLEEIENNGPSRYGFPKAPHVNVATQLLSLPELEGWLSPRGKFSQVLRLGLGGRFHPGRMFEALRHALRKTDKHYHPCTIILGPANETHHSNSSSMIVVNLVVNMIWQLLIDQPSLYPNVQHLFPLVHDAVLGMSTPWKQRILWRCLETLLYSPKTFPTYIFMHVGECPARAEILRRVEQIMERTEIPMRVAVSFDSAAFDDGDAATTRFVDVDVTTEVFDQAQRQDLALEIDDNCPLLSNRDAPEILLARQTAIDILLTSTDYTYADRFMKKLDHVLNRPIEWIHRLWHNCSQITSCFAMINRSIERHGSWVVTALFWISRSARSLSVDELGLIVRELGDPLPQRTGDSVVQFRAKARVEELPRLLPGVVEIVDGRVQLCQPSTETNDFLWRAMRSQFPSIKEPDLHLAETCLLFLLNFYSAGHSSTEELRVAASGVDREARASCAAYAARHWMAHYRAEDHLEAALAQDSVFSRFVQDNQIISSWMSHLAASSPGFRNSPPYDKEGVNQALCVLNLGGRDTASAFRVLELCHHASVRPSTTALLDRLVVYAAELGDGQLAGELITLVGKAMGRDATLRAIASASWSLGQDLVKKCAFPVGPLAMAQIFLAALQTGNQDTAAKALELLLTPPLGHLPEDFLTETIIIACQYHDEATVGAICDDAELSSRLAEEREERGHGWTALHVAVRSGNTKLVSMLLDLGMDINAEDSWNEETPLVCAAARGFHHVVALLLQPERGVDVDYCDSQTMQTTLHLASRGGFLATTRLLLESGADKFALDLEWDAPLHLAIVRGHSDVAELLISSRTVLPTPVPPTHSVPDGTDIPPLLDRDAGDKMDCHYAEDSEEEASDGSEASSSITSTGRSTPGDDDDAFSISTEVSHPWDIRNFTASTVIMEASKSRRTYHVAELLARERVDPTKADEHGRTALHYAASLGLPSLITCLLEAVEELLKHHPDLLAQDIFGLRTPLVSAAYVGDMRIVEALLLHYAHMHAERRDCFFAAVQNDWNALTARLLDAGCSHDTADKAGNSPVHWAARGRNTSLLQLLLARGFAIDPEGGACGTPLCDAARFAMVENIEVLLDAGANIEGDGVSGVTPLGMAVYRRNPEAARLLLQRGARLKAGVYKLNGSASCNTILELALSDVSPRSTATVGMEFSAAVEETTRAVLEYYSRELQVHDFTEDGTTPAKAISLLIRLEKFSFLPQLLDTWPGANDAIVEALRYKESPLQNVAWKGDVDALELILSRLPAGYSLNSGAGTKYKSTPLQTAIFPGGGGDRLRKVELLLRYGADPTVTGGLLGTSLNIAAHYHRLDILKLLLDVIPQDVKTQFLSGSGGIRLPIEAAVSGTVHIRAHAEHEVIELLDLLLLHHGASLDPRRPSRETLLHAAVRATSFDEMITWLQEHGVSPDEGDQTGRRPAHLAIHKGKLSTAKLLFTPQTTPETVDDQGRDCFHYAVVYETWRGSMARDLLEWWAPARGRDDAAIPRIFNKPDINGWTPLHWACRQHTPGVIEYLVRMGADRAAFTHAGWTPWHVAVFHGNTGEEYLGNLLAPSDEQAQGESDELPTEPGRSHNAYCSACYCKIWGTRYRCTKSGCEEERVWCGEAATDPPSLCFKCYANYCAGVAVHYPGHVFAVVDEG
ncbi:hypothetical protein B0T22DRAFT_535283 [Podospora appendiculata]|uniref:Ankyrin n=1 Tax=Podospora appendiculata TaxID=314037 RepID=A0AAE0X8K7_9PEZI|nr:hypothetical protein B0T22DRAFT_535283 [Podospora appendiculata]